MSPPIAREIFGLLRPAPWAGMVNASTLRADAFAGLTGAAIVLPQGIAFAAIAGLPPEYGFYTAMIPPVIAAVFGSSWHLVSGPTTAISALVFGALAHRFDPGGAAYIDAAIALTFLVGVIQLSMGLAKLGALVNFVSHSVMLGFTAGAAVLIALSQVRHALGVDLPRPEAFSEFLVTLVARAPEFNAVALAIAATAVVTAIVVRRLAPTAPNYLIALFVASLLGAALDAEANGVALVGAVPSVVPTLSGVDLSGSTIQLLSESALAIALVGVLEAVSVARAIAAKSGQSLDANREFFGQGASNAIGALFACYAASGSFTRSGVNYDSGARTPMAAVFAALFLLLILLLVAPLFAHLPVPAMAGVIILVAWRLIDIGEIAHIVKTSRAETAIATVTFFATLAISLEFAIYCGVLLSLALFLQKSSRPFFGVGAPDPSTPGRVFRHAATYGLTECPQIVFTRLDGPLYFGSVEYLRAELRRLAAERPGQKHLHLNLKGVGEIDLPGAELLIAEARRRKATGGELHVIGRHDTLMRRLKKFHVLQALGRENVHQSKGDAIAQTIPRLDPDRCALCEARIFTDCPGRTKAAAAASSGSQQSQD